MCGFCGIIKPNRDVPSLELLQSMARTLHHRGPDDEGYQTGPGFGLGFQRLSIIDLAGGHQPMFSEDGSLWLVFNGEIYNYQSLRKNLEAAGQHHFKTHSDTEIILHLYQEYGTRCLDFMRGMFAFGLWDAKNETLFLARDRFGKKPLVYAEVDGGIVFGSELKALLKHPAVKKEINYQAIDLYLTLQYIPSPHTVFKAIHKLPPAHWLQWKKGKVQIQRYWEPHFVPKTTFSMEDASDAMMEKLKESVGLRMISDVPLGAFLSGGRDSSIVVGLMSELSSQPVKTFSIGFEGDPTSELPYAREVAERFGCDHHEFVVKADTVGILPKLAWHYGEPFADPSALPSYYVSQMTRQHVTVALNGDGGDESFAGYVRYQAMAFLKAWRILPQGLRKALSNWAEKVPDQALSRSRGIWMVKRLLRLGADDSRAAYLESLCFFRQAQKDKLYTESLRRELPTGHAEDYLAGVLDRTRNLSDVDAFLYTDQVTYLPECLMAKMDIASMANSLEARSPFLDHEFAELVATFPPSWKLHGLTQSKYILNRAVKGWLPDSIVKRGKQVFAQPLHLWLRGPLKNYVREVLLSQKALSRGLFRKEALEQILAENESGKTIYGYHLWALLMLEHWYQAYIDS